MSSFNIFDFRDSLAVYRVLHVVLSIRYEVVNFFLNFYRLKLDQFILQQFNKLNLHC